MIEKLREAVRDYGIAEWKRNGHRYNWRVAIASKIVVALCWPHDWYFASLLSRYRCATCGSQVDNMPLFARSRK